MKWVIQDDVLTGEEHTKIMAREFGQEVYEFEYIPFEKVEELVPPQDEKAIFRGSLEMAEKLEDRSDIFVYGNAPEFTYSNYYEEWEDCLLNTDVEYIQVKDLSDEIFDNERVVFIRPDGGGKAFTGQCFKLDTTWKACKDFIERNTDPYDWLVVSSKKEIEKEFRFIIYENEVLAGSQYKTEENIEYESVSKEHPAWVYAQKVIIGRPNPKPFWVIDICEHKGKYKVLEINSFSCASWYYSYRRPIFNKLEEAIK